MGLPHALAKRSSASGEQPSFRDVVAYLHGVSDAVQAMKRSAASGWPMAMDPLHARAANRDSAPPESEPRRSSRLTLRYGETEIALEGILVFGQTAASPFQIVTDRGGARLVELEGAEFSGNDAPEPALRGTLPYWAPAVSLVPFYPHDTAVSEFPLTGNQPETSLPYSAVALSLVPIALGIPSLWPEDGEERLSAIRLRSAPISPELYALTGTDNVWDS